MHWPMFYHLVGNVISFRQIVIDFGSNLIGSCKVLFITAMQVSLVMLWGVGYRYTYYIFMLSSLVIKRMGCWAENIMIALFTSNFFIHYRLVLSAISSDFKLQCSRRCSRILTLKGLVIPDGCYTTLRRNSKSLGCTSLLVGRFLTESHFFTGSNIRFLSNG